MSKVKANDYESEVEFYFDSLKQYKRLTAEEEKDLWEKFQQGDKKSFDVLIKHNLRFVVNIAKSYRDRGVSFADIISEGNLGLIHAANKFDTSKGIRFISYAVWWIRYYISNFINQQNGNTEVSTDDYVNYQYREDQINEEFEDNINTLNDRNSTVAELLVCLKNRERKIIQMSFGLNGEREMTLDEISKVTDLSLERVRQIKDGAIMKLKCEVLSRPSIDFNELKILS